MATEESATGVLREIISPARLVSEIRSPIPKPATCVKMAEMSMRAQPVRSRTVLLAEVSALTIHKLVKCVPTAG